MKTVIGQQGEVRIVKIAELSGAATQAVERTPKGAIISHSESGHHHILTGDADVLERLEDVPAGMKIMEVELLEPQALIQDAAGKPHEKIDLPPGFYEFRISREYDPFAEQARRVAD